MQRLDLCRLAAVLTLAVALSATATFAEEGGTLTIGGALHLEDLQGLVGDDLFEIAANGGDHTWLLTLQGTTWSHNGMEDGYYVRRGTRVLATSFTLEFFGPDAAALNAIVSAPLSGGGVYLELRNNDAQDVYSDFATLNLYITPPAANAPGVSFSAGHETMPMGSLFPADADGYPVVGPEPFEFWVEGTYLIDERPGYGGYLISWDDLATVAGDLGTPVPPTLSISDASVLEGNRGSTKMRLRVALANTSDHAITVGYRTVSGTALPKSDYTAASGTLTIPAGTTSLVITVPIKADRTREADETFTVELFNAVGTTIGDGVATATIRNDD
jgi:hypothetical protein